MFACVMSLFLSELLKTATLSLGAPTSEYERGSLHTWTLRILIRTTCNFHFYVSELTTSD